MTSHALYGHICIYAFQLIYWGTFSPTFMQIQNLSIYTDIHEVDTAMNAMLSIKTTAQVSGDKIYCMYVVM